MQDIGPAFFIGVGMDILPPKGHQLVTVDHHPTPPLLHGTSSGELLPRPGLGIQLVERPLPERVPQSAIHVEMGAGSRANPVAEADGAKGRNARGAFRLPGL